MAAAQRERELNQRLDAILGPGSDARAWREHMRHRRRIHDGGHTCLVDYGDRAPGLMPNCLSTLFGHGVYTTTAAMLFNLRLVTDKLYPEKSRATGRSRDQ